jgi:membrane-associated phospholipid phosphatase
MNIDPRFQTSEHSRALDSQPIPLTPPAWLPWREVGLLGLLTAVVCSVFVVWLDRPIAYRFAAQSEETWIAFFRAITAAGHSAIWYTPAVLGFVATYWQSKHSVDTNQAWEWRRRARALLFVIISMAISGTTVNALKIAFGRYRPRFLFNDGTYDFAPFALALRDSGFPSGHTQSIVAAMMALGFLWPRGRWLFWTVAVLVATSRFVITVHYTSDVIAGAFVAFSTAWILQRYFERNGIMLAWSQPPTLRR